MDTGCSAVSPMLLQKAAAVGALPERHVDMAHILVMRPRHDRRPMFSGSELNSLDCHSMVQVGVRQSLLQSKVTPGRAVTDSTIPSNGAAANTTVLRKRATMAPGTSPKGGLNGANDPKSPPGERWGGRDRGRTAVGVVAFLACFWHVALAVARPLARVCDKKGHVKTESSDDGRFRVQGPLVQRGSACMAVLE